MKILENLEEGIQKGIGPLAQKVGNNKVLRAIGQGCMATLPLTIGCSAVSILINLPFTAWTNLLQSTGLYGAGQEMLNVTMSLLSIYMIFTIAYSYCKENGHNNILCSVLAMGAFLILMPSTIATGEDTTIVALSSDYLGSQGIFLSLIVGVIVAVSYCKLMDSGIKIKLPDSIPPMVADSMSSCLPAIIILMCAFIVKYIFTLTPFENVFNAVSTLIQQPAMLFGTSPVSYIIFACFCNLLWFCGIHPAALNSVYAPIIITSVVSNMEAFSAGQPLPYAEIMIVFLICNLGGNGSTLGFCFATLFAKSEKFKAMRKLFILPNIFNINEPIIFGVPLMLNPLYLIPMVFSPLVSGIASMLLYSIFKFSINPGYAMGFPWVTPGFVYAFAEGGVLFLLIWLVALVIDFMMYMPFFMVDDKQAFALEQNQAAEE